MTKKITTRAICKALPTKMLAIAIAAAHGGRTPRRIMSQVFKDAGHPHDNSCDSSLKDGVNKTGALRRYIGSSGLFEYVVTPTGRKMLRGGT